MRIFTFLLLSLIALMHVSVSAQEESYDDDYYIDDDDWTSDFDYENEDNEESGEHQCGTSGNPGQHDKLTTLMDRNGTSGDLSTGTLMIPKISKEERSLTDDEIIDGWLDNIEDGICDDVGPELVTCPDDDFLAFLEDDDKHEDCKKLPTKPTKTCEALKSDYCFIEPENCLDICEEEEGLAFMGSRAEMRLPYLILGRLRFITQWSWLDPNAFVYTFRGRKLDMIKKSLDKELINSLNNSDYATLGKSMGKIRPILQYAYYASFDINHLKSDQKTHEKEAEKHDAEAYNAMKAYSVVKRGKASNLTTQIHNLRGNFEEYLLKTRVFLYDFFADCFKMFRQHHHTFRRIERKNKNKKLSGHRLILYADILLNDLYDHTMEVLDVNEKSVDDVMSNFDALKVQIKAAGDVAHSEEQYHADNTKEMNEAIKKFNTNMDAMNKKIDLLTREHGKQEKYIESEIAEREKNIETITQANTDYGNAVILNQKTRKQHYNDYDKTHSTSMTKLIKATQKLNSVPMPSCRLSTVGNIKSVRAVSNTPSIFDPCKTKDTTVDGPRTDIIFIMDGSGSVNNKDFTTGNEWIYEVSSRLMSDETKAHITVSYLQFATKMRWEFEKVNDAKDLYSKLAGITQLGGGTYMVPALKAAADFKTAAGANKIIVFLTDGVPSDKIYDTCMELKSSPVEIHAIGIGHGINEYNLELIGTKSYHVKNWSSLTRMSRIFTKALRLTVKSEWKVDMTCHAKLIDVLKNECDAANKKYDTEIASHKRELKSIDTLLTTAKAGYNTDVEQANILLEAKKQVLDDSKKKLTEKNVEIFTSVLVARKLKTSMLEEQREIRNAYIKMSSGSMANSYHEMDMIKTQRILHAVGSGLSLVHQAFSDLKVGINVLRTNLNDVKQQTNNTIKMLNYHKEGGKIDGDWTKYKIARDEVTDDIEAIIDQLYETQMSLVVNGKYAYASYKSMNELRYDSVNTDLKELKKVYIAASNGVDNLRSDLILQEKLKLRKALDFAYANKMTNSLKQLCYDVKTNDPEFRKQCESYETSMSFSLEMTEEMCEMEKSFFAENLSAIYGKEEDFARKLIESKKIVCGERYPWILDESIPKPPPKPVMAQAPPTPQMAALNMAISKKEFSDNEADRKEREEARKAIAIDELNQQKPSAIIREQQLFEKELEGFEDLFSGF